MPRTTKLRVVAIAAVLALLSLLLTGCVPSGTDTRAYSVKVKVGQTATLTTGGGALKISIPGTALSGAGNLTASAVTNSEGAAGWKIRVDGGAKLTGTATLRFKHTFAKDEPAPLVTFMEPGSSPGVATEVAVDGNAAVVHTTHFSNWFVTWWNDILNSAKTQLGSFFSGAGKAPTCSGEAEIRKLGYKVTSDKGNKVYWCLGQDKSGAVQLKVANGRGYAVGAESTPGMKIGDLGPTDLVSLVANAIHVAPSLKGNKVTLVPSDDTADYTVVGSGQSGVRVQPSVPGYLVSAAQYAIDTLAMVLSKTGKSGLNAAKLFDWESCFAGYTSMAPSTVKTASQAASYFNDAVGTTLGCLTESLGKAGLGFVGTAIAAGISWFISGVRSAFNGFRAAADTAFAPDGYTIVVTAPVEVAPTPSPSPSAAANGFPSELQGTWCKRSDTSDCFSLTAEKQKFPQMVLESSGRSDDGTIGYTLCLELDMGSSCSMAATMFIDYFPVGVGWNCGQQWAAGCDPDFTSAHDPSKPRIVIPYNHQQDDLYHDSEPMYRR